MDFLTALVSENYTETWFRNGIKQLVAMELQKFTTVTLQCFAGQLETIGDSEQSEVLRTLHWLRITTQRIIVKPKDFQDFLSDQLHFSNDKADVFIKAWSKKPNDILNQIPSGGKHLEGVAWQLYAEVAEDSNEIKSPIVPKGRLQFFLNGEQGEKNISLDMNQSQLEEFYRELENIQTVLDKLKDVK